MLPGNANADNSVSVDLPEDQLQAHAAIEADADDGAAASDETATAAQDAKKAGDVEDKGSTQVGQSEPDPDWVSDKFPLKFRGRQIIPKTRQELLNWAQLGYNYDQRSKALTQREQQQEQLNAKYEQLEQVNQLFEQVPDFKRRVFEIYQEMQGQKNRPASQPGAAPAGQMDPSVAQYISGLEQRVSQFETRFKKFDESAADNEVRSEIKDLRASHPDEEWDVQDAETGKTLEREVVEHAYKNSFPSLRAAYRDLMWESVQAKSKAEALKDASEKQRKNVKAGVVSNGGSGARGAAEPRVLNPKDVTYDQAAQMALSAWK
jgi:hypothetical protein